MIEVLMLSGELAVAVEFVGRLLGSGHSRQRVEVGQVERTFDNNAVATAAVAAAAGQAA